ncbi:sensor histidine kinase [Pseudactinotalea terrae]|uniref:sensor histidine kinase n=1 Tax=Pseudactinotalea terrae TaxID=1743262 RepID=UPI0012E1CAE4|nr:histidine kinase [Pseudactinotalea terrae]
MEMSLAGLVLGVGRASVAVLAVVAAIVWWRGRRPSVHVPTAALAGLSLVLTAAHLPTGDGGIGAALWGLVEIAGLLTLVVVLVRRSRSPVAIGVGALAGSAIAATLLRVRAPIESPADLLLGLFWIPFVLAAAAAGWYLRTQDASHLREVRRVQTEQRLAIAADLHDFVAHEVSAMLFQAQAARMLDAEGREAALALERIEVLGQRALASLDQSVHMLREHDERRRSLSDLRHLAQQFSAIGPAPVDLHVAPGAEDCGGEVSANAYRIVVEALTNIRRHAPDSTEVTVDIGPTDDRRALAVVVENAVSSEAVVPRTAQPAQAGPGGSGIATLAERLEAQGGTLTAGPRSGGGWRLAAVLPAGRSHR